MRIIPGGRFQIAITPQFLGYHIYTEEIAEGPIKHESMTWDFNISVPPGELWMLKGIFIDSIEQPVPETLFVTLKFIKDGIFYSATGGYITHHSYTMLAGRYYLELDNIYLTSGSYMVEASYYINLPNLEDVEMYMHFIFERMRG